MPLEHSAAHGVAGARPSVWNVPNALTALRVLLVPVLGWLLLVDGGHNTSMRIWAAVVFAVAIMTDRFDGEIARRHNLVTDFGKIMDPIADKALTGMAFVGLSVIGELWWWVTIVVLGREVLVTALRFWVIRYGIIAASKGGKIKTMLQALALEGLILPFRQLSGRWEPVGLVLWWAAVALMALAVVVTVVTGVDYVRRAVRLRRAGRPRAASPQSESPDPASLELIAGTCVDLLRDAGRHRRHRRVADRRADLRDPGVGRLAPPTCSEVGWPPYASRRQDLGPGGGSGDRGRLRGGVRRMRSGDGQARAGPVRGDLGRVDDRGCRAERPRRCGGGHGLRRGGRPGRRTRP